MLTSLDITNIVLIEKLNIQFAEGLNIITGETGAGKSILLDALGLAIGARSDTSLIRNGCEKASVTAVFDCAPNSCKSKLNTNGIECLDDEELILRRIIQTDGKSKAWINDTPVSIKALKEIGTELVEIHSQFESNSLLDENSHLHYLDQYASNNSISYTEILQHTTNAYNKFYEANKHLLELEDLLNKSEIEKDFLEHSLTELRNINPKTGEEEELSNKRTFLMNIEKNSSILKDALACLTQNGKSLDEQICSVAHILERIKTNPNPYEQQINTLYTIADSVSSIISSITPEQTDIHDLDSIEERLFAIKGLARKYRVPSDELPEKIHQIEKQLSVINNSDIELKKNKTETNNALLNYNNYANKLSELRHKASIELTNQVLQELPDLKLGSADFQVQMSINKNPTFNGMDNVSFLIKTNPGSPFASLSKIASGGELARFMLALRVVLNKAEKHNTLIFDEIDTGISGATASAVGQRLNDLSKHEQLLVITHSAQVAGYADKHFKISKNVTNNNTITSVEEITGENRINEIARIISGATITPESIASAKTLIKH